MLLLLDGVNIQQGTSGKSMLKDLRGVPFGLLDCALFAAKPR